MCRSTVSITVSVISLASFQCASNQSLELGYLTRTLDLNVEFDVLRESRFREIAGPHQCLRTNNFELGMGDVRLRVKLALVVHAVFDLTAAQPFENG